MDARITECQTLSELAELERTCPLTEEEQRLVFQRKLEIFQRIGHRDGHDTDTKYRYCRYLQVGGKYRYFHQVSLVFDTEPALFMVSTYV